MSTDNTGDQGDNTPHEGKCSFPKDITLKYDVEPINQLTRAINQQTSHKDQKESDPENWPKRQAKAQERANGIYSKSLCVNAFITLATLGIFWYTIQAAKASKEAAVAAKDAVTEYKTANNFSERTFKSNNESTLKTFDLAQKAFNAQISALSSNKSQFQSIHQSSIAIGRIEYYYPNGAPDDSLTPKKPRDLTIYIYNLGIHPVHIFRYKYKCIFSTSMAKINALIKEMKANPADSLNQYVNPGEIPLTLNIHAFDENVTHAQATAIKQNGGCTFYFEAEYSNEVTPHLRSYVSVVAIRDHVNERGISPRTSLYNNVTYVGRNVDTTFKRQNP